MSSELSSRALIVDDEEDMRFLVRSTIEAPNNGLSVAGEAADGEEALERWREDTPDIIVLDQRMPGITGIEVASRILAENPGQRIILFSAFLTDDLVHEAGRIGISTLSKDRFGSIPELMWRLASGA